MQKTIIVVLAISAIFAQSPATSFISTRSNYGDNQTGVRYTNGSVDDLRYGRDFVVSTTSMVLTTSTMPTTSTAFTASTACLAS